MLNNYNLGFNLIGRDMVTPAATKASASINRMKGQAVTAGQDMSSAFKRVAIAAGVMYASFRVIKGIGGLVSDFAEFEQGLTATGQIARATAAEMKLLEKAAIDAGVATKFSPTEAVEGLQKLASAGLDAKEAIEVLNPALDLAAGSMGQLGVGEAASAVVGTLKAYQMEVDKATEVTDRLLKITQMTNFQAQDFSIGLSKAAGKAASYGFALEDVTLGLGLLRNANINASVSATALSSAMAKLSSDTKTVKRLQKEGIDVYDKSTGKIRSFLDIVTDMSIALKDMDDAQRNNLLRLSLGRRGILAYNAVSKATYKTIRNGTPVVLKGAEAIAAMRKEYRNAGGTAKQFRERMNNTIKGQLRLISGTWKTIKVMIGKMVGQFLYPIIKVFYSALSALVKILQRLPSPIKKVIGGLISLVAITAGVAGLVAVFVALKTILAIVGPMLIGFIAPILPVLLPVIAAVGALVLAGYALKKAYDHNLAGFADGLNNVWKWVKLVTSSIWEMATTGEIVGEKVKTILKTGWLYDIIQVVSWVRQAFISLFEGIAIGFSNVKGVFSPVIMVFHQLRDIIVRLTDQWNSMWESAGGGSKSRSAVSTMKVIKGIGVAIGAVLGAIVKTAGFAIGVVIRYFGMLAEIIVVKFMAIFRFFKGVVKLFTGDWKGGLADMWGAVVDFVSGVISAIWGFVDNIISSFLNLIGVSTSHWTNFKIAVVNIFSSIWEGIKSGGSTLIEFFVWLAKTIAKPFIWLGGIFAKAWQGMSDGFKVVWIKLKNFFVAIYDWFKDKISWILDKMSKVYGWAMKIKDGVSGLASDIGSGIKSAASSVTSSVASWFSSDNEGSGEQSSGLFDSFKTPSQNQPSTIIEQGVIREQVRQEKSSANTQIKVENTVPEMNWYGTVNVDGDTLGRVVKRNQESEEERTMTSTVPVITG